MKIRNQFCRWFSVCIIASFISITAHAGPEITLREFASGQIKKGVRSIGMGGDGATWGNYSLVYRDAGTALVDYGLVHFNDTGNSFTFTAVGFTTPTFWDDAALYVIGMSQHATDIQTWTMTPANASKPPSVGDGSNQAVFLKFAKPINAHWSAGILLSYELSQMTLNPLSGGHSIRYETAWRPSGGAGVTWAPEPWILAGVRVLLNHDWETRVDANGAVSGMLRSYEYRAGVSIIPWQGGILDAGFSMLDRSNSVEGTKSFAVHPTLGAEQALIEKALWLRTGLDETSFTAGTSAKYHALKVDLAYVRDIAAARTGDIFGKDNNSGFATVTYAY